MKPVRIGRWRLLCDVQANQQAYAAIPARAPELCECCYCRNFLAVGMAAYPAAAHQLFESIGIIPVREAETYELGKLESGLHLYGGFFHFVGVIEEGTTDFTGGNDLERLSDRFSLGFTLRTALVPPAFDKPPLVQIEFLTEIPWVLAEAEPTETESRGDRTESCD